MHSDDENILDEPFEQVVPPIDEEKEDKRSARLTLGVLLVLLVAAVSLQYHFGKNKPNTKISPKVEQILLKNKMLLSTIKTNQNFNQTLQTNAIRDSLFRDSLLKSFRNNAFNKIAK